MIDIISPVIGWIPKYVIDPLIEKFRVIRNLGGNIEELKNAAEKLDGRTKDEHEKQKEAKKQEGVGASADAGRWFSQADVAVSEANVLRTKYEERQSRGACSNYFCFLSGYQLSKRAFNLKKCVDDLYVEDPKFGWTAASTSQTGKQMNAVSLEGQTTRDSLKDEIIQGIMAKDKYAVVGLHGMGGIGKTTLLKHVFNHFTNTEHFDSVIFTTVSATPDFVKLRREIAEGFGLKDSKDDNDVKQKLFRQTGKYLLILDDMWEPPVDLEEICIPAPTKENGCKIIMASRSLRVITKFVIRFAQRDSLHAIPVNKLQPHEAWDLFVKKVGKCLITSQIKPLAEEIVRKCDGLPLAITVIGGTMSTRQTKGEWEYARDEMKRLSKSDHLEGIEEEDEEEVFTRFRKEVFSILMFSFEKLSHLEKSLFLYCCLFPEDAPIYREKLYNFGIGEESLCDKMETLRDMRNKIDVIVGNLTNSSMLELTEHGYVKVHDVLREFGLWITSPKFIAKNADATKASEWSEATKVSLYSVETLPDVSDDCPNLHTLMLSAKYRSTINVPQPHFLEHMASVQVLVLSDFNDITHSPPLLSQLVNLRLLSLRNCHYLEELPPEIGMLVQLISLDLESCIYLQRLPVEMKELKHLRRLNINYTNILKRIPPELLSGLHKLEEIESIYSKVKLDNDNMFELCQLKNLTRISSITLGKVKVDSLRWNLLAKCVRHLKLRDCNIDLLVFPNSTQVSPAAGSGKLFRVSFKFCKGFTRIPTHDYTSLGVASCPDLKTLLMVDDDDDDDDEDKRVCERNNNIIIAFQHLKKLKLQDLDELETICSMRNIRPQQSSGPRSSCLFSNLEEITIEKCPSLKVLFASGVTPLLPKLMLLKVYDCSQLEYLMIADDDIISESIINAFSSLHLIYLCELPELTAICTTTTTTTTGSNNNQCPSDLIKWPSLFDAHIYLCPKLRGPPIPIRNPGRLENMTENYLHHKLWANQKLILRYQEMLSTESENKYEIEPGRTGWNDTLLREKVKSLEIQKMRWYQQEF